MAMLDWKDVNFPDLIGVRSYPKLGPYEESKKGDDTSWKLAQHFQHASICKDRIDIALAEFVRLGAMKYYTLEDSLSFSISLKWLRMAKMNIMDSS